jgi:site-specific DNA-cytosine methylase
MRVSTVQAITDFKAARAVEFFSGIGAFAQAARALNIEVVAAFDQSQSANLTYRLNYRLEPKARNLDSLDFKEIPEAEIWWMSPPCTPFSVRGKRRDEEDPRAISFLNLIKQIGRCLPAALLVENVSGFVGSQVHKRLREELAFCRYAVCEVDLCPTDFGVPMRRPRHFVVASRQRWQLKVPEIPRWPAVELGHYLDREPDAALTVENEIMQRYGRGFDIVDSAYSAAYLTCFTSGYWRCRKASGSLIALPNGGARRVSPPEIQRLLGFCPDFQFPESISLPGRWRLLGNSVDVRAVEYLLNLLELSGA